MTNIRKVFIFFGIPGSGKSFLGKKFAENHNFIFYEADDDYTNDMRNLSKKSISTKKEINQNFYILVRDKTKEYLEENSVVVATAIGNNIDRQIFFDEFRDKVVFVKIEANQDDRIKHTLKRESKDQPNRNYNELKDSLTSHLKKKVKSFEEPNFPYIQIHNNYKPEVLNKIETQLTSYIN